MRDASLLTEGAAAGLFRTAHWRQWNALVITTFVVLVTAVSVYVVYGQLMVAVGNLSAYFEGKAAWESGKLPWPEYLAVVQLGKTIELFVWFYGGIYLLPFIVALPFAAPLIVLWRDPPVFLFLRPFHRRPLTRALSRTVRRDIARFGHVYTLADTSIFVPWYVRVPLLFGQISLLSFRMRRIKSERQIRGFAKAVERTTLRNVNWCLSLRKAFAVATDDAHWQQIVELLALRSQLVFMDLSDFKPNVLWELLMIRRLGLEQRALFFLRDSSSAELIAAVEANLGSLDELCLRGRLFYCDDRGVKDPARLRSVIGGMLSDLRAGSAGALNRRGQITSIIGVALFIVGCLPLLSVLAPAWQDRLQRSEFPIHFGIFVWGCVTWVVLWMASYWNRQALFLAWVQTFLIAMFLFLSST
jgi:hypothetical protein